MTWLFHPPHHGIVTGFLFVTGGIREADFEEIRFGVESSF
jgi:hypothetical protein